jgi:DnaK suppressor protein
LTHPARAPAGALRRAAAQQHGSAKLNPWEHANFPQSAACRNGIEGAAPRRYNPGLANVARQGVCMGIELPAGYRPSESEPFMNERQREYFRRKLARWKDEILRESRETIQNLQTETTPFADLADRASTEAERQLELRTRDRQRKLIAKIDAALRRLEDGSYGFCEETGEPISLKRLDARPIATLSIEAQERHERRERVYRDD